MRGIIAVVACIACSSEKAPQPSHGSGPAIPPPTYSDEGPADAAIDAQEITKGPHTLTLPAIDGAVVRDTMLVVAKVPGGWTRLEPTHALDGNRITIDAVKPITIPEIVRESVGGVFATLVVVDAKTPMSELHDLGFALHRECWTFASSRSG